MSRFRTALVLPLAALAFAGCGESSAEKDAKAKRRVETAIQQLNQQTRSTAQADIEVREAELKHRVAEKHLRDVERALREERSP